MNLLFDPSFALRIGWALIHFVWQATLLALLLKLALATLHGHSAQLRYVLCCGCMAMFLIVPVVTFLASPIVPQVVPEYARVTLPSANPSVPRFHRVDEPVGLYRAYVGPSNRDGAVRTWIDNHIRLVLWGWGLGVLVLTLRLGLGWRRLQRLVQKAVPVDGAWAERLQTLSQRLGLTQTVRLLQLQEGTPMTLGWLRPIILVPISCLSGLPVAQIDAILGHELAHIRRHDYLVNLLQSLAETLLFYHPLVWWVSAQIRLEREHCCDDVAVMMCGDPLLYARALANLESMRVSASPWSLASTDGPLLERIRRVVDRPPATGVGNGWAVALALIMGLLIPWWHVVAQSPNETAPALVQSPAAIPKIANETNRAELSRSKMPQVMVEMTLLEITATALQTTGLDARLRQFRDGSPVWITNRSGIVQGPSNLGAGASLFDNPALRGIELVSRGGFGLLTEPEFADLRQRFEKQPECVVMAAPRIITLNGRQARVQIVDVRNIVSGLVAGETNTFTTSAIPFGSSVDLLPVVRDDGERVEMTIIPELTAFLGYHDPGPLYLQSVDGKDPVRVQIPLPRLSAAQTTTKMTIPLKQTAVLSGFHTLVSPTQAQVQVNAKQVVLFITPSLIDAMGRRWSNPAHE